MSLHRSLKYSAAGAKLRNVFKRVERLQILRENERWDPGSDSVYGLPKVRTRFKAVSRKKKKNDEDDKK
ncbi:MAG: small basic protein [Planctomycetes bacterium]|nr:small basic protein [Planctomycetota bacterium]MCB9918124.1 small basic protein [Planctomycetota bacterium]